MSAYGVVHYLLQKQKGSASAHPCVDCDGRAVHWSYDHQDVFERVDELTEPPMVFSVNFEHYQPRCGSCHLALDRQAAKDRAAGKHVPLEDLFAPLRTRTSAADDPADPRHGSGAGYISGCRCDSCREAWRDQGRAYRRRIAEKAAPKRGAA
ncbi:MAG: hypothetical protein NVS3B21_29530 [Acidimicrobiales bacterium]